MEKHSLSGLFFANHDAEANMVKKMNLVKSNKLLFIIVMDLVNILEMYASFSSFFMCLIFSNSSNFLFG